MGTVGGNPKGVPCPVLGETLAHLQSRPVSVKINPAWVSDTSESAVGHAHRFHLFKSCFWEGGDYPALSKLEF